MSERRRMLARDVLAQAMLEPLSRPGRTLLTTLGTVLGVGLFVATLGFTATARSRVNQRFDALAATEVVVRDAHPDERGTPLADGAGARIARLHGVTGAGLLSRVEDPPTIARLAPRDGEAIDDLEQQPPLTAIDVAALAVVAPRHVAGRLFDRTQARRGARVCLLGRRAARQLGIAPSGLPTSLSIGGARYVVEGVVGGVARHDELLDAVLIPRTTALRSFGAKAISREALIVGTRVGYATSVGAAAAAAASPIEPDRVAVVTPPDPTALRGQITNDLSGLFVLLGGVGLLVGMVGIGNTTLLSVLERVKEIGVRRSMGARRGQIATQFLLESLAVGTLGGIVGAAVGVVAVAGTALAQGWAPSVPVWLPACAPLLGTVTGLLAGSYPAARAARIDPVTALSD